MDYEALGTVARTLTKSDDKLIWVQTHRRSDRRALRDPPARRLKSVSGRADEVPIRGLVGQVTFTGQVAPFLPYVALATVLGLGRNRAMGLGQLTCELR